MHELHVCMYDLPYSPVMQETVIRKLKTSKLPLRITM